VGSWRDDLEEDYSGEWKSYRIEDEIDDFVWGVTLSWAEKEWPIFDFEMTMLWNGDSLSLLS